MPRRDVVFYAPWAGPTIAPGGLPTGGAEVQVSHLARGLARGGARVAVIVYAVADLPPTVDGVEVIGQSRGARGGALARRAATFAHTVAILARTDGRTVVQRSAGAATGLVAIVARLTRRRFVYSSSSLEDFTHRRRDRPLAAVAFGLGLLLANEIVVQTDEQAERCAARHGRRPVVIRSVAEPAPDRGERAATGGLLWIGRLSAYKNPHAFVDLAAALPDTPCTMVCVPALDDPPGVFDDIARRAALVPNLDLRGPLPRARLLELVADATAIVSTSDFEGMPNTLLEGWSRGAPALTLVHDPDGVIERERLGHCAHGDPAALADAARAIWAGRGDDRELRERCRAHVRRVHDAEVVVGQWKRVLGLA